MDELAADPKPDPGRGPRPDPDASLDAETGEPGTAPATSGAPLGDLAATGEMPPEGTSLDTDEIESADDGLLPGRPAESA